MRGKLLRDAAESHRQPLRIRCRGSRWRSAQLRRKRTSIRPRHGSVLDAARLLRGSCAALDGAYLLEDRAPTRSSHFGAQAAPDSGATQRVSPDDVPKTTVARKDARRTAPNVESGFSSGRREELLAPRSRYYVSAQVPAWPWSLLERPLATKPGICAQIPSNPPGIEWELGTGAGETSVETACKPAIFERTADPICTQEVTGSNPVGSTGEVPAKWHLVNPAALSVSGPFWSMEAIWKPLNTPSSLAASSSLDWPLVERGFRVARRSFLFVFQRVPRPVHHRPRFGDGLGRPSSNRGTRAGGGVGSSNASCGLLGGRPDLRSDEGLDRASVEPSPVARLARALASALRPVLLAPQTVSAPVPCLSATHEMTLRSGLPGWTIVSPLLRSGSLTVAAERMR